MSLEAPIILLLRRSSLRLAEVAPTMNAHSRRCGAIPLPLGYREAAMDAVPERLDARGANLVRTTEAFVRRHVSAEPAAGSACADSLESCAVTLRVEARREALSSLSEGVAGGAVEYAIRSENGEILISARILGVETDGWARYTIGGVPTDIDWSRGRLSSTTGVVGLSDAEVRLLRALVTANGRVVASTTLTAAMSAQALCRAERPNTLAVRICGLRKRLAAIGVVGALVAVRGIGYCLAKAPVA